jgi:murein peptide amidase A
VRRLASGFSIQTPREGPQRVVKLKMPWVDGSRRAAGLLAGVALVAASSSAAPAARIAERETFGRSVKDVALKAVNIAARNAPTRVLVFGSIHGNELAGKAVLRELREMRSPVAYELWLVWELNPDGASVRTRQNARGVDLNRNFPNGWRASGEPWDTYYPGPRPLSEPESRAAVRLIKEVKPDITIWYHQAMELVTKMKRHRWTQRRYARLVGLPLERLAALPGTATRWQNNRFPGHTAFVVELPAGRLGEAGARTHARAVRSIARAWAARRSEG